MSKIIVRPLSNGHHDQATLLYGKSNFLNFLSLSIRVDIMLYLQRSGRHFLYFSFFLLLNRKFHFQRYNLTIYAGLI